MIAVLPRPISSAKEPGRTLVMITPLFDAGFGRDRGRDGRDGDAELAFACVCFLWGGGLVLLACDVGVGFGAVTDDDSWRCSVCRRAGSRA